MMTSSASWPGAPPRRRRKPRPPSLSTHKSHTGGASPARDSQGRKSYTCFFCVSFNKTVLGWKQVVSTPAPDFAMILYYPAWLRTLGWGHSCKLLQRRRRRPRQRSPVCCAQSFKPAAERGRLSRSPFNHLSLPPNVSRNKVCSETNNCSHRLRRGVRWSA